MGTNMTNSNEDPKVDFASRRKTSNRRATNLSLQENLGPEEYAHLMESLPPDETLPLDAFALSQNELRRELADRGINPKGFFQDDANRLQQEFDQEHLEAKDERRQIIIENAIRKHTSALNEAKKAKEAQEIREEMTVLAQDPALGIWMNLLKADASPNHATLRLNNIGARALSKTLWTNTSLLHLNLGRNQLDDMAGLAIATMCRHNTSLRTLDLDMNDFGPATASEFASVVDSSYSLRSLNLEHNPLTRDGSDLAGIQAFAQALEQNSSLIHLNIWHTSLGPEVGPMFVDALTNNSSLISFEFGHNRFSSADELKLVKFLERNQASRKSKLAKQWTMKCAALARAKAEQEQYLERKKSRDHEQWIEERKAERVEKRLAEALVLEQEREAAEAEAKLVGERKAREAEAKAEADKKKKKGKGKKKK